MYKTIVVHVDGSPRQASRYREWVLGGATRALLDGTPVPLLLAH